MLHPLFALGINRKVLVSGSYAFLIVLMLFFLPSFSVALYNDVGNDSCLTIYSDRQIYRANDLARPNTIDVLLTIENKCGSPIIANIGLLTETKHTSLVMLTKAETITKLESQAITNKITGNVLQYFSQTKSFETKIGWENYALADGNTQIKIEMKIPHEEGEFIITATNLLKPEQSSTLDPTYLGAGSFADPYVITTCIELQDVNAHLNDATVFFKLGNNIDCTATKNWNGVGEIMKGFEPLGTEATPFKGHFNGDGHYIYNLTIYSAAESAALFGSLAYADINNLGIKDINVYSTAARAAGIVGTSAAHTAMNNVYLLGGTITGKQYTGGIIGIGAETGADKTDLNQVYTKDVNINNGTSADIGGIAGYYQGNLWNCYSTSKIYSTGANKGGLVGRSTLGTATNSYWNPTDSIVIVSALGTEKTQAQMKKEATYSGWDFVNIWTIVEDVNAPRFGFENDPAYAATIPDLNFIRIGNKPFVFPTQTFAYAIDGNLLIDFNVFHNKNNRLSIDLNYSASTTEGTGNVIVKDLNLIASICPDQDWNDMPSPCSWDFNIIRTLVLDGNYYLLGKLSSLPKTKTKASPTTFFVANDVNIVVKRPIDEETGQVIDQNKYKWTIRIWDETGMRYYQNQIDQNGFMVPLGSADAKLEIDTNTADFFPRQYKLIYLVPTATDTLQPYLVKQSVSGNFIFNVTNIETLAPISGVQIEIYGYIPDLGIQSIQTIQTDAAGLATIPLRLNSPYTIYFYYVDALVHSASITPTAASLYYQVQLNISTATTETPSFWGVTTSFSPTNLYVLQASNGSIDLNARIWITEKTISRIQLRIFDTNGCLFDNNIFSMPWADGNTIAMHLDLNTGASTNIYSGLACDGGNFPVFIIVDVNTTDGNTFSTVSIHWQIVQENNYKYGLPYLLEQLGKNLNASPSNKLATTFLAFFVLLLALSGIGFVSGGDPLVGAMLACGIIGFFVVIGWVDFLPFMFISIATFFVILYAWGRLT